MKLQIKHAEFFKRQIMKLFQNILPICDHFQVNLEQYKWPEKYDVIFFLPYLDVQKTGRLKQL